MGKRHLRFYGLLAASVTACGGDTTGPTTAPAPGDYALAYTYNQPNPFGGTLTGHDTVVVRLTSASAAAVSGQVIVAGQAIGPIGQGGFAGGNYTVVAERRGRPTARFTLPAAWSTCSGMVIIPSATYPMATCSVRSL
jgi:hypothetical protein